MSKTLSTHTVYGIAVAASVLALLFAAYLASAETAPTITTVVRNTNNATTTSAAFGSVVHADVLVSSTTAPVATSTVDFFVYSNQTCSGNPSVQNNVALEGGRATSATSTVSVDGISYKVHYDGESGVHSAADGECTAVVVTGPNTRIQTTLSTTSVAVLSSVFDTAVLSGHTLHASGTVAYTVYSNSGCSANPRSAGVKTVSEGAIPNSDSLAFNSPGAFYWQAVYSGDFLNAAATSSCTSEILNVFATSTPRGRITVDKVTVPEGDATSFHFDTSGTGYADFDLTGSSTPNTQELAVGTYRINEQNKSGWTTSAMCSKNGATATQYSEGSNISLGNGDVIVCTFTNTKSTTTPPKDRCDKDDNNDYDGDDDCDKCGNNGLHKGWFKNGFPFENGSVKKFIRSLPVPTNDNDDDDDDDDAKPSAKVKVSENDRRSVEWRLRNRSD
ncbi:hypothetical protein HY969_04420 [Candidatus Kaiserbacteria bacterium]|nr:hypothetical protein [Candidatus Kaiserbacteria bacterium]